MDDQLDLLEWASQRPSADLIQFDEHLGLKVIRGLHRQRVMALLGIPGPASADHTRQSQPSLCTVVAFKPNLRGAA